MKRILALLKRASLRLSCLWRHWLAERRLERHLGEVEMRYAPMLAEVQRAKDDDKYQELLGHLLVDHNLIVEPVLYRRTVRLMRKARRWLVPVPARPSVDEDEKEFWRQDQTGRFWYLKPEAELEIRKAVRKEWLQFTSFWITTFFGFLGLLIGLVSVWPK
jgi:hypothetical protein